MFREYRTLYIRESEERDMRILRRFRWVIGFGCLKMLAVVVLFVYGKHRAAAPPVPTPGAVGQAVSPAKASHARL
jgi:hypothetical protein